MNYKNALQFVEVAALPQTESEGVEAAGANEANLLDLNTLPDAVVSTNTLIDYSAASADIRGGLSLALTFASRTADAARKNGDDEQDWFAAYQGNLRQLGIRASQTAETRNRFRKKGLLVHKAIIPFLMTALGGAGIGPVMIGLLEQMTKMNEGEPWIKLFDQESRRFSAREMHFAAVGSGQTESTVRHVAARLEVKETTTNVLFFKVTDASAEFESATTTFSANNDLLAALQEPLKRRLKDDALRFIRKATLA